MSTLAPMSIGSEILRVRREANMTQKELAEKLDCDQRTVSQYERGSVLPSAKRLKQIEEIFNKEWRLK